MATSGELTVGKLKKYLNAFSDDTRVVIGQPGRKETLRECHANTYYPDDIAPDKWPWVVIDARDSEPKIDRDKEKRADGILKSSGIK